MLGSADRGGALRTPSSHMPIESATCTLDRGRRFGPSHRGAEHDRGLLQLMAGPHLFDELVTQDMLVPCSKTQEPGVGVLGGRARRGERSAKARIAASTNKTKLKTA